jgi:exopolyphosphatase / guanosine-5'-triphosphate,3'-diphosphate pyrophosphatase
LSTTAPPAYASRRLVLACIDIGSNTTRLLVADARKGRLQAIAGDRVFTRLGRSMLHGGAIPEHKIAETAEVVAAQAKAAREAGALEVAAVATAAIRRASNSAELAAVVEDAGGMPLWILSADEEARLSFLGATRSLSEPPNGTVAVADVGGGSTEIAVGTPGAGVSWSTSLDIGSGLLADEFVRTDPAAPDEIAAVRRKVDEAFGDLDPPATDAGLAVGGTATSLRRLVGRDLSRAALEGGLEALTAGPVKEIAARHELDPERVRLLPAGIVVLEAVSECLGLPLRTAPGGLREGVVLELLDRRQGA